MIWRSCDLTRLYDVAVVISCLHSCTLNVSLQPFKVRAARLQQHHQSTVLHPSAETAAIYVAARQQPSDAAWVSISGPKLHCNTRYLHDEVGTRLLPTLVSQSATHVHVTHVTVICVLTQQNRARIIYCTESYHEHSIKERYVGCSNRRCTRGD